MNDPESMSVEEAAELLGVSREASAPVVERAYAEKLEALEKKIAQAPTAALKNKYRLSIDRLKAAREVLASQDTGSDLPSLDISHQPEPVVESTPAPAPVAAATKPVPAPAAPSAPRKPLPVKAIAAAIAGLGVVGFLVYWFAFPPATAKWEGDYRAQVAYSDVIYNYHVHLSRGGEITGTDQIADRSKGINQITGSVNDKGEIKAEDTSGVSFTGEMKGDEIIITEKLTKGTLVYKLKKDFVLPSEIPQAKWAGLYHELDMGRWQDVQITVEPSGEWKRTLVIDGKVHHDGSGKINTVGKITGSTGSGHTVTGSAKDGVLELLEKDEKPGGTYSYEYKLTKGKKEAKPKPKAPSPPPPPATAKYAGIYEAAGIKFPGDRRYAYVFEVADDGSLKGYEHAVEEQDKAKWIKYSGMVSPGGFVEAKSSSGKTIITGTIEVGVLSLSQKLGDSTYTFKLYAGKADPLPPFKLYAGTYRLRKVYPKAVYDYEIILADDGSLTGQNQEADGTGETITISGSINEAGQITARGSDEAIITGSVSGMAMELKEKMPNQNSPNDLSLVKWQSKPGDIPQAAFAGTYTATLLQPGEVNAVFTVILSKDGTVSGTRVEGTDSSTITGKVNTAGLVKATTGDSYTLSGGMIKGQPVLELIEQQGESVINDTFRLTKQ